MHELVARNPPLDPNSVYCNLLQCSHFGETAIIAKHDGAAVGFVSGYRIPNRPECLFIWQIVVDSAARGQGLAARLLNAQLQSEACAGVRFIETTITQSNEASRAVFKKFANAHRVSLEEAPLFDKDRHFDGQHDSEYLIRIGPFTK